MLRSFQDSIIPTRGYNFQEGQPPSAQSPLIAAISIATHARPDSRVAASASHTMH